MNLKEFKQGKDEKFCLKAVEEDEVVKMSYWKWAFFIILCLVIGIGIAYIMR